MKRTMLVSAILAAVLIAALPAIASAGKDCSFTGWKNGFQIVDETGNYSFLFTGGMQQRLQVYMPEVGEEKPELSVEKARIIFKGSVVDPRLKYYFQYELSNATTTQVKLLHARLDYEFADEFQLRAGRQKTGYSRGYLTGWMKRLTPDVSIVTGEFSLKFDTGLKAVGSFQDHLVEYEVGAWNGNGGSARVNDDTNFLYAGKVLLHPLGALACDETGLAKPEDPLLSIGGKFYLNKTDATTTDPVTDMTGFGGEAVFNWRKVIAQAEYFSRKTEPDGGAESTDNGFYVQAAVFPIPTAEKVQLFGRFSTIDYEGDPEDTEITAGANYYFHKNNWKASASFSTVTEDDGQNEVTNDKFVVQMQIFL
ncbi:MAG: hypothetical protein JW958_11625 [Candidatus Eisenbacteria bacterium]|nr:hypothetical protein [Candidatus Eisenbacteria bacterium]